MLFSVGAVMLNSDHTGATMVERDDFPILLLSSY